MYYALRFLKHSLLKEIYFHQDTFEKDVSFLLEELRNKPLRRKTWDAEIRFSALIVTDMQNYFLSPGSHSFIPSAGAIVHNINKLIRFFHCNERPVIFTRHINDNQNSGSMAWWWNDLVKASSSFAEITDEIDPKSDRVIVKSQYDAFYSTGLDELLVSYQVQYPVFCGVMTNLCCETSVRSAFVRGFRPVLPIDATATYLREMHLATFRNLSFGFSPVLTTTEVIEKLRA